MYSLVQKFNRGELTTNPNVNRFANGQTFLCSSKKKIKKKYFFILQQNFFHHFTEL
jgi:hypothetical protein